MYVRLSRLMPAQSQIFRLPLNQVGSADVLGTNMWIPRGPCHAGGVETETNTCGKGKSRRTLVAYP